jgi:succinate-semialdehyde dehydrogenase/glutarate-semialdehyde dehydrogenase
MRFETINPATGEWVREYEEMTHDQVEIIIENSHRAQQQWRFVSFAERAEPMMKVAALLRERKMELAALMTQEMGKPLAAAEAELEKCAWACEFYAERAEKFLADEIVESDATLSKIVCRPIGLVLAVMPWNFPYWQVFRFAAPAVMAGNGVILKHAANVCGSALAIEKLMRDAGFPAELLRTIIIDNDSVENVIKNRKIRAVTLTGSTRAGRAVGSEAGLMLKKAVLELGGSDAYVVLADADIDAAVKTCVTSRLQNSGQSCIAAKRFVVDNSILEEFTEKFVAEMQTWKTGDPLDPETDLGPQARFDLRDELHRQVVKSVAKGAKLLLGGKLPGDELSQGAYYFPTVLTNVKPGMPAYDEELFGPVASIIAAEDEADAIRIANDSPFGLGGAVFTRDIKRGEEIATYQINSGACFVNGFVKSDPRLPFGGIGDSGYGRELSYHGIKEFVNIKTVSVA